MDCLLVGFGGFLGAIARFGASSWLSVFFPGFFPLPTLIVNFAGSLALGLLLGIFRQRAGAESVLLFWGVGFLGAFTTFSTFSVEAFELLRKCQWGTATFYGVASVTLCILGAWLGFYLAGWLAGS